MNLKSNVRIGYLNFFLQEAELDDKSIAFNSVSTQPSKPAADSSKLMRASQAQIVFKTLAIIACWTEGIPACFQTDNDIHSCS